MKTTTTPTATVAITWESLHYAGDVRGNLATWFGLHPLTSKTVYVTYDRETTATTSRPRCPELEAVARFATLVRDAHAEVRKCRFTDPQVAMALLNQTVIVKALPGEPGATVLLEALKLEAKRRDRLGPIAEAQRTGGDVRRMVADDLGFSEAGC